MRYIVALLFIIFFQSVPAGELKIIFRYDDYSRNSNTDVERLLFDTIKNIGGGVLVGVIPFPHAPYPEPDSIPKVADLGEDKVNLLKEYASQGVVEIAVHGYSHKSNATEGSNSEFTGLSKNTQNLLLGNARAALEVTLGFSITSFIPPFNQYDLQTLQSLESTSYKLISAALGGPQESTGNLTYLPGGAYPQKINEVISSALASGHTEAIVVIVMHPYDIIESGDQMSNFREDPQISIHKLINDLSKIKKRNNVHFMTIHELFEGGEEFSVLNSSHKCITQ
ncbi:DUF2334 domain-containing protein [methanotrophic endosymbiont of Bathymodiolus puteoserpentis (Logatchev)]|uniref:DUF2334 domain-containing protein n=1 Tax=methanotrophic endosymbiont of Bathymodiolus puteoserpentis (Logatchev) TaxID=343235 RepID=UPI0013C5ACBC|nr:DUF2334 domain-containing protein [methanotrophic endosymbiont of Bathymodiolus puteoserpentis (Logatchev)]SHE19499.1 hypothetical protein BPUTEOMOX_1616 [methanotrophic endosymbiont of Bathymodiolus puteoserpentis (Logatchev)]